MKNQRSKGNNPFHKEVSLVFHFFESALVLLGLRLGVALVQVHPAIVFLETAGELVTAVILGDKIEIVHVRGLDSRDQRSLAGTGYGAGW